MHTLIQLQPFNKVQIVHIRFVLHMFDVTHWCYFNVDISGQIYILISVGHILNSHIVYLTTKIDTL